MEQEEWRPAPGWDGVYEVSNQGRVRKNLIANPAVDGYLKVTLQLGRQKATVRVHQLVAVAFLGPRPEGMEVNHKNGDKADNRVENLEYVTDKENFQHARRNGLLRPARGEQHRSARLTAEDVWEIRRAYAQGEENMKQLALRFKVRASYISQIINRKKWKHIGRRFST